MQARNGTQAAADEARVDPRRHRGPVAAKASGRVTLPRHIAWSFPYDYDLDDRKQLRAAYERVMTEGLDDDVGFYIDLDTLLDVWDELWLSPHVREAWSAWMRSRGLIG